MVVNTKDEVVHPEGMILLLNGNLLKCEKKVDLSKPRIETGLQLNPNSITLQNSPEKANDALSQSSFVRDQLRETRQLFDRYAWKLYGKKDEIYSDSRMFLAPVDVGCNIAYSGTSGFKGMTLGVWLEWWDSNILYRRDEKGFARLLTYVAGSPLSGMNRCSAVAPDGKEINLELRPFHDAWTSLMRINSRYADAAAEYESYSLREVIGRLFLEDAHSEKD